MLVAVQLGSLLRAHTTATAHPDRVAAEERFGADAVVSYRRTDLLQAVRGVSERGYDVIFDHRTSDYFTFDIP